MNREQGYDLSITSFSPEGRIFQVEYAIEAIRHGSTAIGVKSPEGVVLVVEKRIYPLQDPTSIDKIFCIDKHVGAAIAGLTADARVLIDHARVQAQINRLTYDEPISIYQLVRKICDLKQVYTQHAGGRPFGVSLLVAGIDSDGPQLIMSAPSGAYWSFKAQSIGAGSTKVQEFFEKEYKPNLTLEESIILALQALEGVLEAEKFEPTNMEIAIARADTKEFTRLTNEEIQAYISKVPKPKKPKKTEKKDEEGKS
ncbi:MAG: archaeal proteasome endopeptidase complex subunit alpha [Candidatus Helarchaeota archaeon]